MFASKLTSKRLGPVFSLISHQKKGAATLNAFQLPQHPSTLFSASSYSRRLYSEKKEVANSTPQDFDSQFSGGLSEAAKMEMEQMQDEQNALQTQPDESDVSSSAQYTDHGYSEMTTDELYEFLPQQDKDTLREIALHHGLPNVSKKTPAHTLRDLLMHYKMEPEDALFNDVKKITVPAIVPKGAYKKKYWGHQWVYDPEEARRWPTVKFILKNVDSSTKKMHITAEFIKGLQLKEAIDQLILWRKKTNIVTANFLWSCMKIAEHNYSFVQDDILVKDVEIQKLTYLKRLRYHGKAKFGVMHRRKCNVVFTLCEVPRSNPDQKIGRFGWKPETWRKFEETYPEIIAQMEEREELERQAAIQWRNRVKELSEKEQQEERQKYVEKYQKYFKGESKFLSFDLVEEPRALGRAHQEM